jgi:dsDNA-binding SOS-regulon protein
MQACLAEQIGRNIEVYIDNIVVKTKNAATLIDDLRETFDNLDRYKIKLNPKKCFFGVPGGQVLGYFISARGIEANPLKIKAILDMEPPKNLHQVQQLAGRLAALSRFIAKLGEKALPFYNLMKKSEKFEWTKEAQDSFDNLKKILSTSPVLVTPREKETLLMYIAATAQVFSSVLVVEREEAGRVHGVQRPVYYLSEVLTPARQRYPHHQKLAYAVWRSARKLRHYFTEHPIKVVSEAPLKSIMTNPEATGRVSQWAIELAPHDITYVNRTAVKSQILPDFVADWIQSQTPATPDMSGSWVMYFHGSKQSTGARAGVVLI